MSGLLICAAALAAWGSMFTGSPRFTLTGVDRLGGLALIAVALWLAYAAGGAA